MSAFGFRRAPGVRWTPSLRFHQAASGDDTRTSFAPMARGAHETVCDLALPPAFALRREACQPVTPRSTQCCPVEATALRQWCVRLQRGACPLQAQGAPEFLKKR
ncbi:hypothetical protein [Paraburkholderia acidisoli]|uniref:Uncharacterized protein n=1 Tax=Paraburkholderia acidisoli TaxID=2571748 RepID=A0A7Z2GK51_9BURK|nr:hypothetical protein [Paraburkholderia acidisoli]QGZ63241.1 hypothetical protein FAZ98_15665 [Paraburkholderia acidisoli]